MKSESLERNALVISLAGHDKGQAFVITERVDDNYVLVVGGSRSIERPKRKRIKHVKALNEQIHLDDLIRCGDYNNGALNRLIEERLKKIGRSASVQR